MMRGNTKRRPKPIAVHAKSTSSVVSELSNPSDSESEPGTLSIPEPIEEGSYSEENPSSSHNREVKKSSDKSKSGSKKSKKKSKKSAPDDSGSDGETSTKSGLSKKRKKKKKKKKSLEELRESEDEDLFEENEALHEEVISLRRKLNVRGDTMEMTQMQMDLKRALNEAAELKSEIDEYEEAVAEKDGLIKKLTEAVDCQLDKVEYLELKLQRAEDEFVKMEDEMKDMEDEIEELKDGSQAFRQDDSQLSGAKMGDLEDRERELEDRENSLIMKEQELLDRERDLVDREEELDIQEEKLSDQRDDLRMKELQFEEREREAMENNGQMASGQSSNGGGGVSNSYDLDEKQQEINTLKRNLALKTGEVHELRGQLSRPLNGGSDIAVDELRAENDVLKSRLSAYESTEREWHQTREDEARGMQMGADAQMQNLLKQNESLKRQIEALQLASIDSDIHEQLNKKDEFARRKQEEIDQVWQENETLKSEVKDQASRLKETAAELAEVKASSAKKLKQKDETIEFMQGELVRLTMEKKLVGLQTKLGGSADDEAEMLRIQAFNEQIRVLYEGNQELENKLKQMKIDHEAELQRKEAQILDLEETIEDLESTMETANDDANNEEGNEDRKKKELKKVKKELKESRKRISELEIEIGETKDRLEKEYGEEINDLIKKKTELQHKLEEEYNNAAEAIRSRDEKIKRMEQELGGQKDGSGFGLFSKKKNDQTLENPKPAKGLWGALMGGQNAEKESRFDRDKRENIVPHASPRTTQSKSPNHAFSPIITGQSIEDELKAIEDQARQYEEPTNDSKGKKEAAHHSGSRRVNMTGALSGSGMEDDSSGSEDLGSLSNSSQSEEDAGDESSGNMPPRMNIASRLEELRAKRNKDES